jgi:hypothetical protein
MASKKFLLAILTIVLVWGWRFQAAPKAQGTEATKLMEAAANQTG